MRQNPVMVVSDDPRVVATINRDEDLTESGFVGALCESRLMSALLDSDHPHMLLVTSRQGVWLSVSVTTSRPDQSLTADLLTKVLSQVETNGTTKLQVA